MGASLNPLFHGLGPVLGAPDVRGWDPEKLFLAEVHAGNLGLHAVAVDPSLCGQKNTWVTRGQFLFWTRGKFLFLTRGRFKFWTRGFLFTVCPVRLHNAPIVGDVFALSVDTVQTHIEFRHLKWCTVWKYQRQLFCPIFPGVNLPYNFRTVRWCIWFSSGTFSSCPFPTSRGDCLTKKTRGKTSCKARGQNTW